MSRGGIGERGRVSIGVEASVGQGRALRATSVLSPFHAPLHTKLVRAASCGEGTGRDKGGAVRLKL